MQVLKFGGSSVANAQNIRKVISIIKEALKKDKTAVVSSAISGCTDNLIRIGITAQAQDPGYSRLIDALETQHIDLIQELIPQEDSGPVTEECRELFNKLREICKGVFLLKELSDLSMDHIVSFGELLSTRIISAKLKSLNISHQWKDARELIKTAPSDGKNAVLTGTTYRNIREYFGRNDNKLYILPGFIASDEPGRTTTLGRGGSDYTASILAVGTEARVLEIWTDVCGMMTADPRIVPEARTIRNISYKEALELSHFGAKVVYPPTIQPVVKQGIPIYVKNTFDPADPGTLIERNPPEGQNKIKGISSSNKIALLSMEGSGMVGVPGYSSRLFGALAENHVNIILITQASSVHTMCIAIDEADAERAKKAVDDLFAYEISLGKVDPLKVEKGFSILSLVGDDMKNQSGASGKMFDALGREGINIRAIAQGSSEKNVSAVLHTQDVGDAIRAVHKEFFSGSSKRINLFIAGYGTVSKALVRMIRENREYLSRKWGKELVICGICNSRRFIADRNGLELDTLPRGKEEFTAALYQKIETGEKNVNNSYLDKIVSLKLGNSVFVDCTASKAIAGTYADLFRNKFTVVACNKIANSLSYEAYEELFAVSRAEGAGYYYETTVCAALPILAVIRQIVNSGDRILKMEGILSGTLNYLFSRYDGKTSFARLVEQARQSGYTEPDPRIDLSGTDVLRKFLIAVREAGEKLESGQIDFKGFIPDSLLRASGPDFKSDAPEFYRRIEAEEPALKALYEKAAAAGKRLRFVAVLERPSGENREFTARIGVQEIGPEHPFYNVEGTDNAVIITTGFYPRGILIKGAGAGPEQTAGGLLNDIVAHN